MKLGEAIYKAQAEAGAPAGAAGAAARPAATDKVVDADFEEVDERKKGNRSA
jgi:molecular chaperone DnaK